jgi:hypothetical protein
MLKWVKINPIGLTRFDLGYYQGPVLVYYLWLSTTFCDPHTLCSKRNSITPHNTNVRMDLLTRGPIKLRTNHEKRNAALLVLVGLLVWIELVKSSQQLRVIKGSDHGTTTTADTSTSMHRAVFLYLDEEREENMEAITPFTMAGNDTTIRTKEIKSIAPTLTTTTTTRTTTDPIIVDDFLPCDDIDNENSSSSVSPSLYKWLGNQWMPPKHVPFYTPEMMRTLLGRQNVLWVGDSTARQDHATMWSMLNATNVQDVTLEDLKRDIQKGVQSCTKGLRQEFVYKCHSLLPLRTTNNNNNNYSMSTTTRTTTLNSYEISSTRDKSSSNEEEEAFFDLYNHQVHFLDKIPSFWNQSQFGIAQHKYSAVVISIGVWDIARGRCSNLRQVREDLLRALNSTRDFVLEYNNRPSSQNKTISHNDSYNFATNTL